MTRIRMTYDIDVIYTCIGQYNNHWDCLCIYHQGYLKNHRCSSQRKEQYE